MTKRMRLSRAKGGTILALILCACVADRARADTAPEAVSPLGAYLAARHAQEEHDYSTAAGYMNRALAGDPTNFDLMKRAFAFRVSRGDITEAIPLASRIADLDRRSSFAQLVVVLDEMKAGHFDEALKRAQAIPPDGAERLAAPLISAWAQVGLKQPAQALLTLAEANANGGVQELNQLHRALIADFADRIDEAAEQYDKLTAADAHLTWRTVELAGNFDERHQRFAAAKRLYERMKDGEESSAVMDLALKRLEGGTISERVIKTAQDGAAEALFDIASVLNQRETLDASMLYARLALYLRPNLPIAQLLLAEIADEEQHRDQALALYRAIDPASPLTWSAELREAGLLDQLEQTDEAVTMLRKLAAQRPRDPEPMVELGDLLRGRSRFTESVAAYDGAFARIGPEKQAHWRLYYARGVALERAHDWPRAEKDLQHALQLSPEQPLVLNYLGYSWIDQGVHLDEALKMVERAVSLRPNDGYIVDSLGWAHYRLGNYGDATRNLERAIEMVPEDPTINDHLGDAYWQTGRRNEARFQWRRALQFKPEADEVTKIQVKLEHGIDKPQALSTKGG